MLAVAYNHSSQEWTSFTEKLIRKFELDLWVISELFKMEPNQHYWYFKIFTRDKMFCFLLVLFVKLQTVYSFQQMY